MAATRVDPRSEQYLANREAMLAALAEIDQLQRQVVAGGGSTDPEKPPRNLLTGANLGENAVLGRVEVDLKGLLVGIELVAHSLSPIENRNWPGRNLGETGRTPTTRLSLPLYRQQRNVSSAARNRWIP